MSVSVKLEGFKEFDKFLKELPEQPLRRATRGALKASAKPIVKAAKDNLKAHKHTGKLRKSIKSQSLKKGRGAVVVVVGPTKDAPHAHLVEFGTGPRQTKDGKSTGQMPAIGFLRRATDTRKREQQTILRKELGIRIEKEAVKVARKNKTL